MARFKLNRKRPIAKSIVPQVATKIITNIFLKEKCPRPPTFKKFCDSQIQTILKISHKKFKKVTKNVTSFIVMQ